MSLILMTTALLAASPVTPVQPTPLTPAQQQQLLAKTQTIRLEVDLTTLSEDERFVVGKLIEVGRIFQDVHEESRHKDALRTRARLEKQQGDAYALYRLFAGPIATTLDNQRLPFVPVDGEVPGRNLYPWGLTREELNAFIAAHPEQGAKLTDPLTVVRRSDKSSLQRDRQALRKHPVLATLHPELVAQLAALARRPDPRGFYAVPYAVAFADPMVRAHQLLREAAARIEAGDPAFADYLRHRGRDLLANDYEAGDASWVTGTFKTLNAQIGAYETYDDELLGQKAFYSLSVMRRDDAATQRLEKALSGLQKLEDALPYAPHKAVRTQIPLGVYEVVADFGQSRSSNTASILPNDADHANRYGRTVLMRANVLRHPALHQSNLEVWTAVLAPAHHGELHPEGKFNRTVWHEIGHYLGPDRDGSGRPLSAALADASNTLEEMKADLVSLYSAQALRQAGFYDETGLRQVYANGIHRTLNEVKPRRAQPYNTMYLIQFNWFVDQGLIVPKPDGLHIDYTRYHPVVTSLLKEVLALQARGDRDAADAFITRWTGWEALHQGLAEKIQAKQRYRFNAMRYSALGD